LTRVKDGRWGLAYKLFRNQTIFPAIVSELCEAPCRAECQRSVCVGDEAIDARAVEAAAVNYARDRKPEVFRIPQREQRVAIVGAGLAGLSLALNLAQKAYPVTVFERGDHALWTWAEHPKFNYFLEEVNLQCSEVAIGFEYGREISLPGDTALEGFSYVHDATGNAGAGVGAMEAIANGVAVSKAVEAFLQTGRWPGGRPGAREDRDMPVKHYVDHASEPRKPVVLPTDPVSGYTKDEAAAEASRCMGCDCRACMDACVMLGRFNKRPQKIAIEAYSDTKAAPPFVTCSLTRETYSCNLCGYCKSVCPVEVDLEKLFHLARAGRAETGKHPRAFHDFWLRDFEWHRTKGAYSSLSDAPGFVFFPGCKAGARSPAQIKGAAAFLKERYAAGVILDCCGAPAYWAGEDGLFRDHIDGLREKWRASGKPAFVFACAYCTRLFDMYLPEIEKVSLYELLAESGLRASPDGEEYAVFDPCMARDFPGMQEAVRKLASAGGLALIELPEKNHCCGYGGHMRVANPDLYKKVAERRSSMDEAPYIVYCANCAATLALEGKRHAHILDLVFPSEDDAAVSLQRMRDNAAFVKTAIAGLYGDEISPPPAVPDGAFRVEFPPSLIAEMDRRLILEDEVREAVYEAERTGSVFIAGGAPDGAGLRRCRLVGDVVTIWVEYKKVEISFGEDCCIIMDVWNHRMRYLETE